MEYNGETGKFAPMDNFLSFLSRIGFHNTELLRRVKFNGFFKRYVNKMSSSWYDYRDKELIRRTASKAAESRTSPTEFAALALTLTLVSTISCPYTPFS